MVGGEVLSASLWRARCPLDPPEEMLGALAPKILLHEAPPAQWTWAELVDTATALQLEMREIPALGEEGFSHAADVVRFSLVLMQRVGFFLENAIPQAAVDDPSREDTEPAPDGLCAVRPAAIHLLLDGLLSVLTLAYLVDRASLAPAPESLLALHPHHREASLDHFYELSMLSDLAPGFIAQYRRRFPHLFHSVSQAIYFHYPQYERRRQIDMAALASAQAPPFNVLPLIAQVLPDVPLYFEHTGAGCASTHAKHPCSFALLSGHVFLLDRAGNVFCARDLRNLYAKALEIRSV